MTEPGSGAAQFAVAGTWGPSSTFPEAPNIERNELVWIDRRGNISPSEPRPWTYHATYVSPDGTRVASTVFGATDAIVVYDLVRRSLSRIPSEGNCGLLRWQPDGRQLLYGSDQEGLALMLRTADGSGAPRRLDVDVTTIQVTHLASLGRPTGASSSRTGVSGSTSSRETRSRPGSAATFRSARRRTPCRPTAAG